MRSLLKVKQFEKHSLERKVWESEDVFLPHRATKRRKWLIHLINNKYSLSFLLIFIDLLTTIHLNTKKTYHTINKKASVWRTLIFKNILKTDNFITEIKYKNRKPHSKSQKTLILNNLHCGIQIKHKTNGKNCLCSDSKLNIKQISLHFFLFAR